MTSFFTNWHTFLDWTWLLFLLLVWGYFWQHRRLSAKTKHWKKTQGRITHCEWTTQGRHIWPKIEYIYDVDGQELRGEHLFLDTLHNTPESQYARQVAYKAASAYKQQTEISVYYNPEKPEQAVLDTTIPKKLTIILIFITLLILFHITMMVLR
jgi:hypothetical protein